MNYQRLHSYQLPLVLLMAAVLCACSSVGPLSNTPLKEQQQFDSDSLQISLSAINLSEDMSKMLSTQNDELLMLIYALPDSGILSAPLFQQAFVIKENNMNRSFQWHHKADSLPEKVLLLLIEQDFDRPIEQIDPVVRIQYEDILSAFRKRDYGSIKKYLGNEDLLGYKVLTRPQLLGSHRFKIEGVHKLDWYEYLFTTNH